MKALLSTFLTTGGIQIANLITGILAARLLLPEGRGELALLFLWPVLIADLGSMAINSSVGFHSARADMSQKQIWSGSVAVVTLLSPILVVGYLGFLPLIFEGQRPEVIELAMLGAVLIPLHLYGLTLISQFQGVQDFDAFNLLRSAVHFVYLGLVVLLVLVAGEELQSFLWAVIGSFAIPLFISIWLGWRRGWVSLAPRFGTIKALFMYGLRTHISTVLNVLNRRLDQIMISIALSATDLGLYVVAVSVEGMLFLVASTLDLLLFPKISEQRIERSRQEVLGRYFRAALVLMVPASIVLLIFTPFLIELIFGAAFLPAVDATRILILSGIPYALKVMLSAYMRGSNRMRIITKSEGVGIVVTVVSLAALVPLLGLIGAAIAQVLAFTIPTLYMAILIRNSTGLSLRGLFRFERRDLKIFEDVLARFRASREENR